MRYRQEEQDPLFLCCPTKAQLFAHSPQVPARPNLGNSITRAVANLGWLVAVAIALGFTIAAQEARAIPVIEDARLDPAIRGLLAAGPSKTLGSALAGSSELGIPTLIRGDVRRSDLEALGIATGTHAGPIVTADVPLTAFSALMALPGVVEVELARPLEPLLDVSSPEIAADACWGDTLSPYPPPYAGTTGAGIIVGIVDTGIDLDHQDFRDASGNTRIKYLWDQTAGSNPPAGFSYGTEWTAAQINAGSATQTDTDGHGTHIAGIAAGNGRATGNGYPAYRYVGTAPQADIVVVKSAFLMESKVIDGVNYVFQKANQLGKDAVVLLAFGTHHGAHDGSYSLDEAISALTGPGRLVVAAAGNDAKEPVHASLNLGAGQTGTTTFSIPTYTPSQSVLEFVDAEGWHDPTASFDVKLTSPTGYSTGWVAPGTYVNLPSTNNGGIYVENAVNSSSSGAKKMRIYLSDTGYGYSPTPGTWALEVKRLSGTQTGRWDGWMTGCAFPGTIELAKFTSNVEFARAIRSPATGNSVISVGAYVTKTTWTNGTGGTSFYPGAPPLGQIADFSSIGPRRDGVSSPDICAPGFGVMAALSTDIPGGTSTTWQAEDGVHRIRKGTSMAAAHVAGGLALFLQEEPDLTPSQARAKLADLARSDSWTGVVPNATWGSGKAFVAGSALSTPVVSFGAAATPSHWVAPNPSRGDATFHFSLTDEEIAETGGEVVLRIYDVEGREVSRLRGEANSGPQALTWPGLARDGRAVAPGTYFGRLGAENPKVWQITKVR
jgi:subtilisin family serine protease